MNAIALRTTLRLGTQDEHDRLDALIGSFDDRDGYTAFLVGSYRFRASLKVIIGAVPFWPVDLLLTELQDDLQALGAQAIEPKAVIAPLPTLSEQFGLLYVLEGSALGARLLVRRAEALGMNADHGARHLSAQVRQPGRWRDFLDLMASRGDLDPALALSGAKAAFAAALTNFMEVRHEPFQRA